jgi:hypothetical protein
MDIKMNFKEFVSYTPNGIGPGSYVPMTWSNSDSFQTTYNRHIGYPPELPEDDFMLGVRPMDIPRVTRKGLVTKFHDKKNPMFLELSDGTKLFLTLDQYRRIRGHLPIVPKHSHVTVIFQRLPNDNSLDVSQVEKIYCKFLGNSGLAAQYNVKENPDAFMLNP